MSGKSETQSAYLNNPDEALNREVRYKEPEYVQEDVKEIARAVVKGPWLGVRNDEIEVLKISGGITNLLWHLRAPVHGLDVLVRVYGYNTEIIIDRPKENAIFAELSKLGFAPTYFGRFLNGRVEGYLPARPLQLTELSKTSPIDFVALIARELARMHVLDVQARGLDRSPLLWGQMERWLDLATDISFDDPDRDAAKAALVLGNLPAEIAWLKAQLFGGLAADSDAAGVRPPPPPHENGENCIRSGDQSCRNKNGRSGDSGGGGGGGDGVGGDDLRSAARFFLASVVFGHQDLLAGNIIYGEGWDRVQIIDFEYGGYNYRGFDIANHFCEHAGFDSDYDKSFPTAATEIHFLREYVRATAPELLCAAADKPGAANGKVATAHGDAVAANGLSANGGGDNGGGDNSGSENGGSGGGEAFLGCLKDEVNRWTLASHLFWGIWAVIQAKYSPIDFDFLSYSGRRLSGYTRHKQLFFG